MTTFDEREKGFERKFALDEEQKFRANARRNRLLGEWAAAKLGKTGDDAAAYAKEVIASDFVSAGHEDVFEKVRGDLPASISDEDIRDAMEQFLAQAALEVKAS